MIASYVPDSQDSKNKAKFAKGKMDAKSSESYFIGKCDEAPGCVRNASLNSSQKSHMLSKEKRSVCLVGKKSEIWRTRNFLIEAV